MAVEVDRFVYTEFFFGELNFLYAEKLCKCKTSPADPQCRRYIVMGVFKNTGQLSPVMDIFEGEVLDRSPGEEQALHDADRHFGHVAGIILCLNAEDA